jgi:hypothetical protein
MSLVDTVELVCFGSVWNVRQYSTDYGVQRPDTDTTLTQVAIRQVLLPMGNPHPSQSPVFPPKNPPEGITPSDFNTTSRYLVKSEGSPRTCCFRPSQKSSLPRVCPPDFLSLSRLNSKHETREELLV